MQKCVCMLGLFSMPPGFLASISPCSSIAYMQCTSACLFIHVCGHVGAHTHTHTHTHTHREHVQTKPEVLAAQSCLTLCNPMDCSPAGSFVHGILQARTLEWVALSFSRGFSRPRDQTPLSSIAGGFFTS